MVEGLIQLGLLQGTVADNVEAETYLQYCPHKSCHWLGLDVHDVGDYRLPSSGAVAAGYGVDRGAGHLLPRTRKVRSD